MIYIFKYNRTQGKCQAERRKNERENTKYYFSKILGKTLRIAGIIHLCEHTASECISGETTQAAVEIATSVSTI